MTVLCQFNADCFGKFALTGDHMRSDTLVIAACLFLSVMSPAYAYIDPGSGSVVTTAIIGAAAAVTYTARKYFYRIKDLLTGRKAVGRDPA